MHQAKCTPINDNILILCLSLRLLQILMAIDDSESMVDCGAGALALAAMTTVASGLTQLEAGQLAVAR